MSGTYVLTAIEDDAKLYGQHRYPSSHEGLWGLFRERAWPVCETP